LELYGFVPRGEAVRYLTEHGIGPDSPLPVNTHGGHLSDGYIQGMSGLVEAVRQLRGTAVNQVPDVTVSFFGTLSGSAVVLGPPDGGARR
jgi:acetyl-CoA acetyltransferase